MVERERELVAPVVPLFGEAEHLPRASLHALDSPVAIRNAIIVALYTLSNETFVELIQTAVRESFIEENIQPRVYG